MAAEFYILRYFSSGSTMTKELGLTDAPLDAIENELLGVVSHIEALAAFIERCRTPMTIAIQGDWGTGKTSMMNLVKSKLSSKGIECVWFNTWQFSQFNLQVDVPIALMMELLKDVGVEKNKWAPLLKVLCKRVVDVSAVLMAGKEGAEVVDRTFSASPLDVFAQLRELRSNVQKVIDKKLASTGSGKLVIFVDDLDRMNPGKAVELLEVIKNFLDLDKCVFVLAVDYGVVSAGTRQKYGAEMDELKGRSFFDKIIQLPFNLPVSQYNIGKYLKNILDIRDDELRSYKALSTYSIGTNPRSLKRLANIMNLLGLLAERNSPEAASNPEFRRLLFAILCLQLAYEPVYTGILMEENPAGFMDLSTEEREALFAPLLAKCPGNGEETSGRFGKFIEALIDAVPQKEEGERDADLFAYVLSMSGLTASGVLPAAQLESARKSFDPALIAQMPALLDEVKEKYADFWKLTDAQPVFQIKDAAFSLPVAVGDTVNLEVRLSDAGIETAFNSAQLTKPFKKLFLGMLKEVAPEFAAKAVFNDGKSAFIAFPFENWKTPVESQDVDGSDSRAWQVKDALKTCGGMFGTMRGVLEKNSEAAGRLQDFVMRIVEALKQQFPSHHGWEVRPGRKGLDFMHWNKSNDITGIRKGDWKEDMLIMVGADNKGVFMGMRQTRDNDYKANSATNALAESWNAIGNPICADDLLTKSQTFAFGAYLPKPLRRWTKGDYFTKDFSYALDAEQEKMVMDVLEDYAGRFAKLGESLDAWASGK